MKSRRKTWRELKDNKCPNCKTELSKGMFDTEYSTCEHCGFVIKDSTKDLLITRDHSNDDI